MAIIWQVLWVERRIIWGGASNGPLALALFGLHVWLPYYLFAAIFLLNKWGKPVLAMLERLPYLGIGVATILVSLSLTLLRIPGIWWTWNTIAMYAGIMVIALHFLEPRLGRFHAVVLAFAIFSLSAGLWELPYQFGYAYHYPEDITGTVWHHFSGQAYRIHPMYTGGLLLMGAYALWRVFPKPHADSLILLALSVGGFVAWWASGFWVDIRWAPGSNAWYHTPDADYLQMVAWRSSKATLALAVTSLYWPKGLLTRWVLKPFILMMKPASVSKS